MAKFEGTIQEFHHFIGPKIRNSVNGLTRIHRLQREGICEECGEKSQLESAHIHGRERRTIIENILEPFLNGEIVKIDIGEIETKILNDHQPIERTFKFLCKRCHTEYDRKQDSSNQKQVSSKQTVPNDSDFRKLNRIRLWAGRPHQDNHKIIQAYLKLEKSGNVRLSDLSDLCSQGNSQYYVSNFNAHFPSMKTDAGNSHGKVFYDDGQFVRIWPRVRDEIRVHFENRV